MNQVEVNKTKKSYTDSILEGRGNNDYEKYMNTEILLSLQRNPQEMLHRYELLFQITHQSTELWLKLSCTELEEAVECINSNQLQVAIAMINRAAQCIKFITDQLEIFTHMTPWDFQKIRPALGNGSGLESPGWRRIHNCGKLLYTTFNSYIEKYQIDLIDVYTNHQHSTLFTFFESLINLDESISLWRTRHYKVAVRIIGHNTIGTKGTPVDKLANLLNHKYFPKLWEVRSDLSSIAKI